MYFPKFTEENVECGKCEKANCHSREKYQRNKRHFSYQSGRCPRLPDTKGFVIEEEKENQKRAYSNYIHASHFMLPCEICVYEI